MQSIIRAIILCVLPVLLTVSTQGQLVPGSISPTSQTINAGATATPFDATDVSGGNPEYEYLMQWQSSTNGSTWSDIPGATSGSVYEPGILTVTTYFRLKFSQAENQLVAYSNVATVTVNPGGLQSGTISPDNLVVYYNTSPQAFTGTAASGGNGVFTYQWQRSSDNASWTHISGATALNYASGNLTSTTYFRRSATSNGITAQSNVCLVTVVPQLQAGTVSPGAQSIVTGTAAAALTATDASGGYTPYSHVYQWQQSTDGVNWASIPGANSRVQYLPGTLTVSTSFRLVYAQPTHQTQAISNVVTVSVFPALQPGTVSPATSTINFNTSPGLLSGTTASGGSGTYTYQWQQSTDNSNWNNISGATAQNYTPANLTGTMYFRRSVTSAGLTLQSNVSTVTVLPPLQAGVLSPSVLSINYNTSPGQLSGTVATGGNGSFSYQWQQSVDNVNWSTISGATAQHYSPAALTANTYFRRSVTSNGVTVQSNSVTITVFPQLAAGTVSPVSLTINNNTSTGPLSGTSATGGNGSFAYQWQQSLDNFTWSNINGATNQGFTPGNLTSSVYFRRSVTSNGVTAQSNVSAITVLPALNAGTITGPGSPINYNTTPSAITGTAASGGSGSFTYQWQRSTDNATWNPIAGAVAINYTPQQLTSTTWFRRRVDGGGTAYSNIVAVTVYPQLEAGALMPGSLTINSNASPGLLGGNPAKGGNGTYVYQWQESLDNISWSNVSGGSAKDYNPGNLVNPKYYRRQVTSSGVGVFSIPILVSIRQAVASGAGNYSSATVNYIRTYELYAPEQGAGNIGAKPLREAKMNTSYLDGLGRPIQEVLRQGALSTGLSPVDLVVTRAYDAMGREALIYLPFAANNAGGNTNIANGLLKRNALSQLSSYGASQFPGDPYLYARTVYEMSPDGQVDKSEPAGESWVGSGRGTTSKRETNTAADDVKRWNVTNVAGSYGTYAVGGSYPSGELEKLIVTDEQGGQQIEFKDKEGRLILKKRQLTALPDNGAGSSHAGWICTYHIYDDLGLLRCTIQPTGVELIQPGWSLTDPTILAEQCLRYEYDNRGRLIKKSLPGSGETWMVYDARDRLVLAQDASLRAESPAKWLCNKYDDNNRLVATGLYVNNQTQDYHASQALASINYPGAVALELLTETHYDDYNNLPAGFSSTANTSDPVAMFTGPYNSSPEFALPWAQSKQTAGLVTWRRARILGTSDFITTVHYYDEQERVIQTQIQNASGGISVLSLQYSFSGQLLRSVNRVVKTGQRPVNMPICTRYTYDDLGRIIKTEHGLSFSALKTVSQKEYNALGQIKTNSLGTAPSGGALETQRIDYNIRGWMTGVNRSYLQDTASVSSYFGYDLGYEKDNLVINGIANAYASKLFNGNITGIVWKSTGDDQTRKWDFAYDGSRRLISAGFTQLTGTAFSNTAGLDFSVKGMGYDANSNIRNLFQAGWKPGGSRVIDSLSYHYYDKSGRLKTVIDAENDTATRLSDFRSSTRYINSLGGAKAGSVTDYTYNASGNMTADLNKDIEQITYNFLGQPTFLKIKGKGTITYLYDANGKKLRKIVVDSTAANVVKTTTLYVDECVFVSKEFNTPGVTDYTDSLQYYIHPEGKVRWKNQAGLYDYHVKDHLGNVRLVLTEEQQTDAYLNASMETSMATVEERFYSNLNTTRVDKPAGYPTDNYTNPNDKVANVRGDGQKIGPAIVLRVMAGDKFNLRANSWYKLNGASPAPALDPLGAIVSALSALLPGVSGGKIAAGQLGGSVLDPGIISFLGNRNGGYVATRPKAYVNYLLLDDQFKPVITNNGKNSGFEQVGDDLEFKTHIWTNKEITKNGYLYIYVSNETPNVDVYFDNLQVTHIRGPLVEETHYYPSGLAMEGISSKAFAHPGTRQKFNGGNELQEEEFGDGTGLELYDAQFRMYDPQLGRFHQADPLSDYTAGFSTYAFANGNPVVANDPLGLLSSPGNPDVLPTYTITHYKTYLRGFNWPKSTKKEVDIYRAMKYQYDLRRRAGKPETAKGDSRYYLDNVENYRRRYDAAEDGRMMQKGVVAAFAIPLTGSAILLTEAGLAEVALARIAAGSYGRKYGAKLVGATALSIAQNGGNYRSIDVFDIAVNTLVPVSSFGHMAVTAYANALLDYNPFEISEDALKLAGSQQKPVQVAVLDFYFGMTGNLVNHAVGVGVAPLGTLATDIIVGNMTGAALDYLREREKK